MAQNGHTPIPALVADEKGNQCIPNTINGKPIMLPSSANFPVVSAKLEKTLHYGQTATVDLARQAVDAASIAFKTYRRVPVQERRRMLIRAAEIFETKAAESMHWQQSETSCSDEWSKFNTFLTPALIRDVAGTVASAVVGEMPPSAFGATTLVFKEPIGPVLIIPPWNATTVLCARGVANALAAGCSLVLKANEFCPGTHAFVASVFQEAGFPPGTVNVIMSDRGSSAQITEAVVSHPALRKVEFIGSANVGRAITAMAAKYLVPVLLELGDQSPAIVLEDADLEVAASMCARGAMMHHGQVCFSTERIIVQASVQGEFSRHLAAAVKELDGKDSAVSAAYAEKAKATIDAAIADGAKVLYGKADIHAPASLNTTVLTDVKRHSALSMGEGFAPTVFVTTVESEEQAIEEANSRIGGLSASVFTKSYETGLRVARELEFGQVQINNMTLFAEPGGPVTGVKGSGWGSNNGRYGIEEFLFNKAVSLTPTGANAHH